MISSLIYRHSKNSVFLVTRQLYLEGQISLRLTRNHRFHTFSVCAMEGKARGGRGPGGDRRMTREAVVMGERERYISMPIDEKRLQYKCGSRYITLDSVPTWSKLLKSEKYQRLKKDYRTSKYRANNALNDKITIWKGDITKLEIDGIANAANGSLLGGGGVDGAIHAAAGSGLRQECALLSGCDTGEAKITGGYKLPAKYVIHTVGPMGEKESKLRDCYQNCLRLLKENKLRSLAFPCISTGIYGYPNLPAAEVALETTRQWLDTDKNSELVDRIIFCLFMPTDVSIYEDLMYQFFPPGADGEDSDSETAQANDAQKVETKEEPVKEAGDSEKEPMDDATTKAEDVIPKEATITKEETERAKEQQEPKEEQKAEAEGASADSEASMSKPETDSSTEANKER